MIKLFSFILLLAVTQLADSCESNIKQGIAGQVVWLEGNLMPKVNENPEKNQGTIGQPVKREVYVYELTKMSEATVNGTFFNDIQSKMVKKVETDEKGQFTIELPVGKYSLFVKEDEGLFANMFDGEGNINPIQVYQDSVSTIKIEINYKAAY